MSDLTFTNLFDSAYDLEYQIWEQIQIDDFVVVVEGNYGFQKITFLGYTLWSSENDTRQYDEETDTYEDLAITLRRELNLLKDRLNSFTI